MVLRQILHVVKHERAIMYVAHTHNGNAGSILACLG